MGPTGDPAPGEAVHPVRCPLTGSGTVVLTRGSTPLEATTEQCLHRLPRSPRQACADIILHSTDRGARLQGGAMPCLSSHKPAVPNPNPCSPLPDGLSHSTAGKRAPGGRRDAGGAVCRVCPFPRCKYSHQSWLQASNGSTAGLQTCNNWPWERVCTSSSPSRQEPPREQEQALNSPSPLLHQMC